MMKVAYEYVRYYMCFTRNGNKIAYTAFVVLFCMSFTGQSLIQRRIIKDLSRPRNMRKNRGFKKEKQKC